MAPRERWEAIMPYKKAYTRKAAPTPLLMAAGRKPAYPVLQNYDQPGNQIDTEQFHRVPGEYGNSSQHMKHRIG